jgi:predicted CopG family antitoxin
MPKSIKVSEEAHHKLEQLQMSLGQLAGHRQSLSDVISHLLFIREKMGEIKDILEGQITYSQWRAEELARLKETHS